MKDSWEVYNVEESCDILDNMRIPLNGEQRAAIPGGVPYYGANGVQGYISKYLFDEDLILMAEDGGNFEEYSKRPIAYKISGKSWVNNHAHILRAKKGYSQDYIFYSVVHKNIIPFIKGGTRSKLNLSDLKCVEIEFPPLPQQKKIAKILSTVDNVIEKTESAIAKYQAIKQGLMHDLFTRGIDVTTGKLRPTPQEAPQLYKESALGLIPRDWEVEELVNLTKLVTDGAHFSPIPQEKGLPIGNVKDMRDSNFDYDKCTKILPEVFKLLVRQNCSPIKGDVLLSKDGTIGKVIHFEDDREIVLLSSIAIIRVNELIDSRYLSWALQSEYFDKALYALLSGSALKRITLKDILKIKLPFSKDIEEQIQIASRLEKIKDKIQTEQQALAKYQQLKAGLLQDLLTGKVAVSVD
ncbi:restriction endonuclease subunit S [Algibacter sp. AS12]|uniref:restriction endonuclease subunit S n=1 Tax=Algibacter sp. AS12 TaxID=3135773 RepID=UPI00398A8C4B